MWCVVEGEDVPKDSLEYNEQFGWVHSPPGKPPHTVEGSRLDSKTNTWLPLEVQSPPAAPGNPI